MRGPAVAPLHLKPQRFRFMSECLLHVRADGMPIRANSQQVSILRGSGAIEVFAHPKRVEKFGNSIEE